MFRLSAFVEELFSPTPLGPRRRPPGPVVIWNLIRRCNLACEHCYSLSADADFAGELTTAEALAVIDDLARFCVPALILSGGEPLLRPDLFTLAAYAKAQGMYVALSTNGTLIDEAMLDRIATAEFDYVGISLDGLEATHDRFRRHVGAFAASARAVRGAVARGLKVGVRFTLTEGNAGDLLPLLDWVRAEGVPRFYLSHLNYAGRGRKNREQDAAVQTARWAMETLFERCLQERQEGTRREYTTGNQDADGAFFLLWVRRRFPERAAHIEAKLQQWGGNASGVNVANIDNLGKVHPDTMWWHLRLGDVRERPFSAIWSDPDDVLLARLREHPRRLEGRCARCRFLALCNGSSRVRAKIGAGSPWGEDPGCYLYDEEIAT